MAEYTFDKHMMAGERIDIAKAFNDGNELLSPFAVLMGGDFFTENGLYESGLINNWQIRIAAPNPIRIAAPNPKKLPKPKPTEFEYNWFVAHNGEGLKTGELTTDDFESMAEFYSHFPTGTGLQLVNEGDDFKGLWYINSKGDYEFTGKTFTFAENTESFTITWQDDIPGDKGEIVTGFVVRTTPYTEPER